MYNGITEHREPVYGVILEKYWLLPFWIELAKTITFSSPADDESSSLWRSRRNLLPINIIFNRHLFCGTGRDTWKRHHNNDVGNLERGWNYITMAELFTFWKLSRKKSIGVASQVSTSGPPRIGGRSFFQNYLSSLHFGIGTKKYIRWGDRLTSDARARP